VPAKRSRRIGLSAEGQVLYADSSALVKVVVGEPETRHLKRYLEQRGSAVLATSGLALVEVTRAVRLADVKPEAGAEVTRLLRGCLVIDVGAEVLQEAADLTSASLRALDAIHLATALRVEPDEMLVYDRRLSAAAAREGLSVITPGR
jgi:predicted nucleic acid-binding protein